MTRTITRVNRSLGSATHLIPDGLFLVLLIAKPVSLSVKWEFMRQDRVGSFHQTAKTSKQYIPRGAFPIFNFSPHLSGI